jgi:hypothetical protein
MLSDEELNTFLDTMIDAWACARDGDVAEGHACLLSALRQADGDKTVRLWRAATFQQTDAPVGENPPSSRDPSD